MPVNSKSLSAIDSRDARRRNPSIGSSDTQVEEHEEEIETSPDERSHSPSRPKLIRIKSYASGAEGYTDTRVEGLLTRQRTGGTVRSTLTEDNDPDFEIDWEENDKENPREWPMLKKALTVGIMSYGTTTVVLYSTAYTSDIPGLTSSFGITETTGVLGVTTYMFGVASGSLILAPLSEMYGRRPIYLIALSCFILFCLASALAKNIETILITRFFGAFAGAALISNAPGTVNDCVVEKYRALAFSIWSIGPMNGPVFGPVVGGFTFQYLGWRWTNWMVMICAGAALAAVATVPETYAPVLLKKRAAKRRKETSDNRWWTRYDETRSFWPLLRLNLSRPFHLMFTEPICIFWDCYIAIVYGVLYLAFVAYPIVFTGLRGWSPSLSGLAFCGIGAGTLIVIVMEPLLRRIINSHRRDPETGDVPPEAMVSVVVAGSILLAVGQLWFAWTCTPNHHWIVSILAGIPFGAGNTLTFIYASNYLVHSYGIYAASALAGNALLRSILGATLPLAGPAMYAKLGPNWAGCLAGLLEVACIPIPLVFYLYGHKIRSKSPLIREMRAEERRQDLRRSARCSIQSHISDGEDREVEVHDLEKGGAKKRHARRSEMEKMDDGSSDGDRVEEKNVKAEVEKRAEAEAEAGSAMATGAAVTETEVDIKLAKGL